MSSTDSVAHDPSVADYRATSPASPGRNGIVAFQPAERTSFPGLAPVSWPFSKIGMPEQIVMS